MYLLSSLPRIVLLKSRNSQPWNSLNCPQSFYQILVQFALLGDMGSRLGFSTNTFCYIFSFALNLYSFRLQYLVRSCVIILCVLISDVGFEFTVTDLLRSNRCLPVLPASHLFCHLMFSDSWTAAFISNTVTGVDNSGIFSASSAACFANLSAISFPAMPAWSGIKLSLTWTFFSFNTSKLFWISAMTALCDFLLHSNDIISTAASQKHD